MNPKLKTRLLPRYYFTGLTGLKAPPKWIVFKVNALNKCVEPLLGLFCCCFWRGIFRNCKQQISSKPEGVKGEREQEGGVTSQEGDTTLADLHQKVDQGHVAWVHSPMKHRLVVFFLTDLVGVHTIHCDKTRRWGGGTSVYYIVLYQCNIFGDIF